VVVLSIFVNPLQFGPKEDFRTYPRTTKTDLAAAHAAGVDIVFLPEVDEMYPGDPQVGVTVSGLAEVLEGESRPGHFDGVATVVAKLFNLVLPDRTYFGQKDAQQVAVIKALIRDLSYGIDLVVCPTYRESDGLAMSSRNAYLTPEQRERATILHRSLEAGRGEVERTGDAGLAEKAMSELLGSDPNVDVDYARAVDPDDFGPAAPGGAVLLVVAAKIGRTRLIDNLLVERE
jgi:pantoate--beta-alanine ligase